MQANAWWCDLRRAISLFDLAWFVLILGAFLLSGCASESARLYVGKTVSESVAAGASEIPLPSGNWVVLGEGIGHPDNSVRLIKVVFLGDLVDNEFGQREFRKLVVVGANMSPYRGWRKWGECERTDVFYLSKSVNEHFKQDCWHVSHVSFNSPQFKKQVLEEAAAAARQYVKAHEIQVPINMLYVQYHFASAANTLTAFYYFNPRMDGIETTTYPEWENSDWHIGNIRKHPEKYRYAMQTKAWAERWYAKIRAGFEANC